MKIGTYNIRLLMSKDKGHRNWFKRFPYIIKTIKEQNPDILCIQECSIIQRLCLKISLIKYKYVFSKYDKKISSQELGILYKKNKYELLHTESIRLDGNRILMKSVFLKIGTFYLFNVINTHLDPYIKENRLKSVSSMLSYLDDLENYPYIVCGDFNFNQESDEYSVITEKFNDVCKDSTIGTHNGFSKKTPDKSSRIDFIFTNYKYEHGYTVANYNKEKELFPSDHYPVFAEIML